MLPGDLFRRSGALSNTQASRDSEIPRSLLLPHPSFVIKMGKRGEQSWVSPHLSSSFLLLTFSSTSFSIDKARSVAVSIPFCCDPPPKEGESGPLNVFICLVSSRKHEGKFVLPKGGAEKGEVERESAIRELWEEGKLSPHPNPTFYVPSRLCGVWISHRLLYLLEELADLWTPILPNSWARPFSFSAQSSRCLLLCIWSPRRSQASQKLAIRGFIFWDFRT